MNRKDKRAARRFEKIMREIQARDEQSCAEPLPAHLLILKAAAWRDAALKEGRLLAAIRFNAYIGRKTQEQRDAQRKSFQAYAQSCMADREAEENGIV